MDNEELELVDNFLTKDKSRQKRRRLNVTKALRKRRIVKLGYPVIPDWYDNLHQYSKNKIHCSCVMCSFNNKRKQRMGFAKVYSVADLKRIDEMDYELKTEV